MVGKCAGADQAKIKKRELEPGFSSLFFASVYTAGFLLVARIRSAGMLSWFNR